MRNKKPYIFLFAYFLVIFLWLLFCYRQLQKGCIAADHETGSAFKVLPVEEESAFPDGFGQGYLFFGNRDDAVVVEEAEKMEGYEPEEQSGEGQGTGGETEKEQTGNGLTDEVLSEEKQTGNGQIGEALSAEEQISKKLSAGEESTNEQAGKDQRADEQKENTKGGNEQSAEGQESAVVKEDAGEVKSGNGKTKAEGEKATDTEKIRVVLLGAGGVFHEKIILEAGGETLTVTADSPYFKKTNIIRIRAASGGEAVQVGSLDRACGHPSYDGVLEVRKTGEGLVLINEVSLENYVMGVLPSEMPSAYPLEALKAQAVCARTYAKMKQENKAYPQYDAAVDDSTACQVYRNLEPSAQGNQAVSETAGEVLKEKDGGYAECYYYSTSCGRGAEVSVWHGGEEGRPTLSKSGEEIARMNQEFFDFIREKYEDDLEKEEAFYRWEYKCEKSNDGDILERCRKRQQINDRLIWAENENDSITGAERTENSEDSAISAESAGNGKEFEISGKALGKIKEMGIAERQDGGVADCMRILCEKGTVYVWGEYNIRYVLAQGGNAELQSGAAYTAKELLPSAFISLQSICNKEGNMVGYTVVGGGFGHGVGMSQNGAKHMALAGNGYREILETYYPGRTL